MTSKTPKYSPRLTDAERQQLAEYRHTFDHELTEDELQFLEKNGYLVLKNIISGERIDIFREQALQIAKQRYGLDIMDEKTWSRIPFHGCFDIWHTQMYNELRQDPRLYSVFAQLLKTPKLTVSVDRINLKAPCTTEAQSKQKQSENACLQLHTDCNLWKIDPDRPIYQGGLCLQDCPIGGGGFFCIPGFQNSHKVHSYMQRVEKGMYGHPTKAVPPGHRVFCTYLDQADADQHKVEVALNRGDFVIWNNNLPHNGGKNSLMKPAVLDPDNPCQNWRMHSFIMFLPLEGPCTTPEIATWYQNYQNETYTSVSSGTIPKNFATRNKIGGGDSNVDQKLHPDNISQLGQRIFGIIDWSIPYDPEETEEMEETAHQ